MTEGKRQKEAFRELVRAALDGQATDLERQELAEILGSDDEARRDLVRHCQMVAMLSEEDAILGLLEEGAGSAEVVPLRFGASAAAEGSAPTADSAATEGASLVGPTAGTAFESRKVATLRRLVRPLWFGGGCAAAGVLAALFLTRSGPPPVEAPTNALRVASVQATGLVRETELSDGSVMQLAPKTSVNLRFSERERRVELEEGEGLFTVSRDETRPFVVAAGSVRARAVGTAFTVRRAGSSIVVTVIEGRVHVGLDGRAPMASVTVAAGSKVVWDEAAPGRGPAVAAVEPERALSWREGRLEYVREPLDAVVADLNRYAKRPVVLAGGGVERLRVTGIVFTDDVDGWLAGLPESLPVRIETDRDRSLITADETESFLGKRGVDS